MEHIHREKATWCLLQEWDLCCTRTHQTDDERKVSSSSQLQQNEAFFSAIPFVEKKHDTKKGMQFADNNPHLQLFHACSKSRFQFTREGKRKKMPKKNDTQQKWRSNLLLTNNTQLQLGTCTPIPIPSVEEKQQMRDNRLNTHFWCNKWENSEFWYIWRLKLKTKLTIQMQIDSRSNKG